MICVVTDRDRLSAGADAIDRVVELAGAAASAGIDLFQIRERDLEARVLTDLAARCVAAAEGTRTKIVVNDRVDVAIAADADGVHLRGDSYGAAAARSLLGERAVIGRSVHSAAEADMVVRRGGIDYLIFGTMYQTPSKNPAHPVAALEDLRAACRAAAGVPVLAIGGMSVERTSAVMRAGAAGIAAIGLFMPPEGRQAAQHLRTIAAELRRAFDTCGAVS